MAKVSRLRCQQTQPDAAQRTKISIERQPYSHAVRFIPLISLFAFTYDGFYLRSP